MLYSKGVFINQCYDELNVRAPELVRDDAPRSTCDAGAEVHRDEQLRREPAEARAVRAAESQVARVQSRAAATSRARPPATARSSPAPSDRSASASSRSARRAATKRARSSASRWTALAEGGVDLLHPRDVLRPRRDRAGDPRRARGATRTMPVIAQMTIGADGLHAVRRVAGGHRARARRVGRGRHRPQLLRRPADDSRVRSRRWRRSRARKLSAQPNAGMPRDVERPQHVHGEPRSTWRRTRAISCRRAPRSSAAAAARRPSTSTRWSRASRPLSAAARRRQR